MSKVKSQKSKVVSSWLHPHIKEITEDIKELKYNTAISELMVALNKLEKGTSSKKDFETFLLLLAPFAPFITEELWEKLGNSDARRGRSSDRKRRSKYSIHKHPWPKYDVKQLTRETFTLVIQVNGKVRGQVKASQGITQKEAQRLALAEARVQNFTSGKKIKKTIFVKDRLINFVV